MNEVLLAYYLGLIIFALNGINLVIIRYRQRELKYQQERLMKLLIRGRLRRIK